MIAVETTVMKWENSNRHENRHARNSWLFQASERNVKKKKKEAKKIFLCMLCNGAFDILANVFVHRY